MPRSLAKLPFYIKTVAILTTVFLITATSVVLARDPMPENVRDYQQDVFEPALAAQDVNLQSTVYEIYLSLIASMNRTAFCYKEGCIKPQAPGSPVVDAGSTDQTARASGLIPEMLNITTGFSTSRPISSREYLADIGNNLNLGIQPAYAQGMGYAGLRPVLNIWQAFRNMAYLLSTIGFIVLAFMVMFRVKISSQTVITAQSAIIKFVVVVLAITFSYAIAGFIVDLIFLFSGFIIWLFINTRLINVSYVEAQSRLLSGSIFQTLGSMLSLNDPAGVTIGNLAEQLFTQITNDAFADWIENLFGWGVGGLGRLIISIAIIYSLFKLLVQLLFAYLEILLLTILSPVLIIPDILPGGGAFMNWMRRLFANAMVFPTTVFMFLVGIVTVGGNTAFGNNPGIAESGGLTLPFLSFTSEALAPLLGIGFILVTPKVVDMVKNALKVSSFQYMSAIGQAVGVGGSSVGGVIGGATEPFKQVPMGMAKLKANQYMRTAERSAAARGQGARAAAWRSAREYFSGGRR